MSRLHLLFLFLNYAEYWVLERSSGLANLTVANTCRCAVFNHFIVVKIITIFLAETVRIRHLEPKTASKVTGKRDLHR